MIPPALGASRLGMASKAYEMSATAEVLARLVSFPEAEQAARLRRHFPRPLQLGSETPFEKAGQLFRRALWRLTVSACPPRELDLGACAGELEGLTTSVKLRDGEQAALWVSRAAKELLILDEFGANPLGDAILAAAADRDCSSRIFVAPSGEARQYAVQFLRSVGFDATVLQRHQFAAAHSADHAIVIGALRWYSSAVVTAPRAKVVEFVQYDWLGVPQPVVGILPIESQGVKRAIVIIGKQRPEALIDPVDLPPSPNWHAVAVQGSAVDPDGGGDREVQALPVLLSGDYGALIPNEPGVELSCAVQTETGIEIQRVAVEEIQSGMYLLFRTSGGGRDFIREIADRRLGAGGLRENLESWKRLLRIRISERGIERVRRELRAEGARTANIQYWASPDSIRPRSHHDFKVLIEYLGLGEEGPTLMEAADQVFSAHIEAGHYIRHLLEERMNDSDLDAQGGVVRIELEEGDGGELSVFRLIRVGDQQFTVPESAVRLPFRLKETAWLA